MDRARAVQRGTATSSSYFSTFHFSTFHFSEVDLGAEFERPARHDLRGLQVIAPDRRHDAEHIFLFALAPGWGFAQQATKPTEPRRVTFNKDVAPILFRNCTPCHRPGEGAPFNLLTYEDVRPRARLIGEAVARRAMPPWKPDAEYGEFSGDRRLRDRDIEIIQQWVADGALRGEPGDLPGLPVFTTGWQLGRPDVIVSMPEPYAVAADGADVFRNFIVPSR